MHICAERSGFSFGECRSEIFEECESLRTDEFRYCSLFDVTVVSGGVAAWRSAASSKNRAHRKGASKRQNGSDSAPCRSAAARRADLILPCLTLQPPNEPRGAKSLAHRSSALLAVLHLVRHGRSRLSLSDDGVLLFEMSRSNPSSGRRKIDTITY
jgi:hypothetical protein